MVRIRGADNFVASAQSDATDSRSSGKFDIGADRGAVGSGRYRNKQCSASCGERVGAESQGACKRGDVVVHATGLDIDLLVGSDTHDLLIEGRDILPQDTGYAFIGLAGNCNVLPSADFLWHAPSKANLVAIEIPTFVCVGGDFPVNTGLEFKFT